MIILYDDDHKNYNNTKTVYNYFSKNNNHSMEVLFTTIR